MSNHSYNRITLIGNLAMFPDFREPTETSQARAWFRMVVDREGRNNDKKDYVDVVSWDKLAKNVAEHCEKGMEVLVEGSLETRFVDGVKGLVSHVKATKVKFMNRAKKNQRQGPVPTPLSTRERPRSSEEPSGYYGSPDEENLGNPYEDEDEGEELEALDVSSLGKLTETLGPEKVVDLLKTLALKKLEEQGRSRF